MNCLIIFPDVPQVQVEEVEVAQEITLTLRTVSPTASCPSCGTPSCASPKPLDTHVARSNVSIAHENGDVEQSHHRFKEAVDQALRVRASGDFPTRAAYEHFLQNLVHKRNQTRAQKFAAEKTVLRPLPSYKLAPCKELQVVVSQFSTETRATNRSCVPSRLIGAPVLVRLRAERLEGYVGTTRVVEMPPLIGKHQHRID